MIRMYPFKPVSLLLFFFLRNVLNSNVGADTKPPIKNMELLLKQDKKMLEEVKPEEWINIAAPVRDAITVLLRFCNSLQEKMVDVNTR